MAISTEVIRKITIQGSTQGVDQATAALKGLADAQGNVAVVADSSSKRALSAEAAYNRQTLSVVAGAKAQSDLERALKVAQSALAQGVITADEHAKRVSMLNDKYGQLSAQQKAVGSVMQDLNGRLATATGSLGTMGQVLTAFGPVGIGVAAVVGGIALALNGMADASHALAQKAEELRRFSDITGLTTAQVQALRSEASKFGVTGDEATAAIERFTAGFNKLRVGQGDLLTQIRKVNPALADQMQMTTNAGQALTLFGKALAQTDDVFQRNALVGAASGKRNLGVAEFLTNLNVDKLTNSFVAAGKGLDDGLIKKLPQTEIEINKLKASMSDSFTKQFAQPLLDFELTILRTIKAITDGMANLKVSNEFKQFLNAVTLLPRLGFSAGQAFVPGSSSAASRAAAPDSFAQRFQPANDNPLKAFTPAPVDAATSKTLEAQVEDMKKLIAVLGPAATASEQLALKQKELQLAARDAGVSAGVLQRAQAALNAEFALNNLRENTTALGAAATPMEQYTLRVAELKNKLDLGAISQSTFNRSVADLGADQSLTALKNNVAALGSAATAADQYKLKVAELQQQLNRGQITQETFNRAVFEANPVVSDLKSNFGDLAKSMVASMEAGKSFTDSLSTGLKALSARLADKAIEQLLSGDFEKAAISATSAIVTYLGSLFTGNSAAKQADVIKSIDYISQLQVRQVAATQDMATLQGQLTAFDKQANIERMNNDRDGGRERAQLELTLSEERAKIINDFNTAAVAADQQAAADRIAAQDEINKRQQGFQDRLLQATTDTTTLQGQLTILDRQQQREREAEVASGGQALVDLEAAQAAERFNVIKKFNDDIVANAQQAAQAQLDAQTKAARSIVDYINGINVGTDSTLSPQQRLSAAQGTYNSVLALAQSGNSDALGRITTDADNLRKALKDVFASGSGFQTGWAAIQSQLLSLPAVATSNDPVVAAVRDNIVATQNVQVAVQADTTQVVAQFNVAINKFSDAVSYLAQAVNQLVTSNALLDAIRALNDTSKQQLTLLAGQLTSQTGTTFSPSNIAPQTINRNMLDALRAIVVNTYAISLNTGRSVDFQRNGQGTPGAIGVLAGGGWITGGIPNKDSVMLGSRTAIGMPDEFVVNKEVAQANRSWLPQFNETGQLPFANDNLARPSFSAGGAFAGAGDGAGIVAELRRNNVALMNLLSAIGAAMVNAETKTGAEVKDAIVGALKEHTEVVKAEGRQARNNPKAA